MKKGGVSMYYISKDPNVDGLYHLEDKNGNIVDSRYGKESDIENQFLRAHKELRTEDIDRK